jgi:thymidylate synthase
MEVTFNAFYAMVLLAIMRGGRDEFNERTNTWVRTAYAPLSICFEMGPTLPLIGGRRTYPKTMAAEIAWYLQGTQDVTWLRNYTKIWDGFVEDDGVTVANSYGYRWRKHFGRDQIALAINALADNNSTRQAVVTAWDPAVDGLGNQAKNVPCPTHFTLNIKPGPMGTDYKVLNSALFIRSSDVTVGLPYDVGGHCLLLEAIRQSIAPRLDPSLKLGSIHVTLADAHIYQEHLSVAEHMLLNPEAATPQVHYPLFNVDEIVEDPDAYVKAVVEASDVSGWSGFNPKLKPVL